MQGFGAGTWAVLLNSTMTMMNDSYVRSELLSIPPSTIEMLRARGLFLSKRGSYFLTDERNDSDLYDATDVIVDLMTTQLAF